MRFGEDVEAVESVRTPSELLSVQREEMLASTLRPLACSTGSKERLSLMGRSAPER
jgi:hypothetical protein